MVADPTGIEQGGYPEIKDRGLVCHVYRREPHY